VSYDLALWQGEVPLSDHEAARMHEQLYEEYLEADEPFPVVDAITDFVSALTSRWPDTDTDDSTPWASAPLIRGASGPYIYLGIAWSSADTVSAYAAETAGAFGLICFDPQIRSLRTR
jgi:hypothetical protein